MREVMRIGIGRECQPAKMTFIPEHIMAKLLRRSPQIIWI